MPMLSTSRLAGHARRRWVEYVALFAALGGTSYAVAALPANSVGTAQLRTAAVARSDIARASVTAKAIRRGSLRRADLVTGAPLGPKGATGAPGAEGAAGQKGSAGNPGTGDLQRALGFTSVDATSPKNAHADCPNGYSAMGGGFLKGGSTADVFIDASAPQGAVFVTTDPLGGWDTLSHSASSWQAGAEVACGRFLSG